MHLSKLNMFYLSALSNMLNGAVDLMKRPFGHVLDRIFAQHDIEYDTNEKVSNCQMQNNHKMFCKYLLANGNHLLPDEEEDQSMTSFESQFEDILRKGEMIHVWLDRMLKETKHQPNTILEAFIIADKNFEMATQYLMEHSPKEERTNPETLRKHSRPKLD